MKNKIGYLGLLGIPLAVLGVVGSVVFASTQTQSTVPNQQLSAQVEQTAAVDTDNIQDQTNDGKPDTTIEASGSEAPETGAMAEKEVPGGHEDVGVNADHQFEGIE